ncbi:MAG: GNAT family N-acyltransferase, partial [Pseudomonadota bacterium]
EFDVASLIRRHPERMFMELGRSCILAEYRSKRTMELMWQGTWAYALHNKVDVMLGCASFHTDKVADIAEALGFLSRFSSVTDEWSVSPNSPDAFLIKPFEQAITDERKALRKLPPLIKGYLRLGAMFSSHAVPDPDFGTIDILVVLPVERINRRYVNYYGEDASKHRA